MRRASSLQYDVKEVTTGVATVVASADGVEDCSVQLLDSGVVVITRGGFFARARHGALVEVAVADIGSVLVTSPRLGLRGVFVLVGRGESANGGFASNNTNPNCVYFTKDQQPAFERLRRAIVERVQGAPQGTTTATPAWSAARPVVLVITSRPHGPQVTDLAVDLEEREIVEELQRVPFGDRIDLRLRPASSADNLLNDLMEHRPSVLHFSGHGFVEGIVIEGPGRAPVLASEAALARLCQIPEVASNLRLLILNACLTAEQAKSLASIVPAVIGTLDSIQDAAAIDFASGFYNALGRGTSVASAFSAGVAQVSLGAGEGEAQKYVVYRRADTDLSAWGLVGTD
jgi:CHAT domain